MMLLPLAMCSSMTTTLNGNVGGKKEEKNREIYFVIRFKRSPKSFSFIFYRRYRTHNLVYYMLIFGIRWQCCMELIALAYFLFFFCCSHILFHPWRDFFLYDFDKSHFSSHISGRMKSKRIIKMNFSFLPWPRWENRKFSII